MGNMHLYKILDTMIMTMGYGTMSIIGKYSTTTYFAANALDFRPLTLILLISYGKQ